MIREHCKDDDGVWVVVDREPTEDEQAQIDKDGGRSRAVRLASTQDQLAMLHQDQVNGTTTFKDHRDAAEVARLEPSESK